MAFPVYFEVDRRRLQRGLVAARLDPGYQCRLVRAAPGPRQEALMVGLRNKTQRRASAVACLLVVLSMLGALGLGWRWLMQAKSPAPQACVFVRVGEVQIERGDQSITVAAGYKMTVDGLILKIAPNDPATLDELVFHVHRPAEPNTTESLQSSPLQLILLGDASARLVRNRIVANAPDRARQPLVPAIPWWQRAAPAIFCWKNGASWPWKATRRYKWLLQLSKMARPRYS